MLLSLLQKTKVSAVFAARTGGIPKLKRTATAMCAPNRRNFSSSADSYDLVVIGGGPGGYVSAIKAAQLGLKTACVEKRGSLGGTCLNVGCIPSKALLNVSNKYQVASTEFDRMGIMVSDISVDVPKLQQHKRKAVDSLTKGVEFLFRKNKVDYLKGEGRLLSANTLSLTKMDGSKQTLNFKNAILATGSEAASLPGGIAEIDEKIILSSTGALELESVPKSMAVIGGGVIGLELGSVWRKLGSQVTVIEYLDRILPPVDLEIASMFMKILQKGGIEFQMSSKVVGVDVKENSAIVHTESASGGNPSSTEFERVLVAVGRKPFTGGLGLEELGIEKDKTGRLMVDKEYKVPGFPHIRAIGDIISGPMLAHKAEEEGIACVELIANVGEGHVNYSTIPSVVYTHPEMAGVGKTEDQLKAEGVKYGKGTFPFAANSRARTNDDFEGMVKILTDKETDRIVGAWILGPEAGELISEVVLAIEYGAASEDLARTCHAHPTLSEAVKEACMAAYDKAIHI